MKAYRSRYGEFQKLNAKVIAISTDSLETQKKFKAEIAPEVTFIADSDKKVVELFDGKNFIGKAGRKTYVIGKGRKILQINEGSDALDPNNALAYCNVKL